MGSSVQVPGGPDVAPLLSFEPSPREPASSTGHAAPLDRGFGGGRPSLAACGDDSPSSNPTTTGKAAPTTTASGASAPAAADRSSGAVHVRSTDLGEVLVDAEGFSLYAFTPDTATSSACTGSCAATWPPVSTAGDPSAGSGVTATLTTITRDDGTVQVVAGDHPLYRYSADAAPGDVSGQGSGGKWFVVTADGSLDEQTASEPRSAMSTSGRYGY